MNNSRGVAVRPNNIKQINGDFLSDCPTVGTMRGFFAAPT